MRRHVWLHTQTTRILISVESRGFSTFSAPSAALSSQEPTRLGKVLSAFNPCVLPLEECSALRAELWESGIVVIRLGRKLTAVELEDFARKTFGEDVMSIRTARDPNIPEDLCSPGVAFFGNPKGLIFRATPFDPEKRTGTQIWHFDKQLLPAQEHIPHNPYVGIMHSIQTAYPGHTTSFLDMHVAYTNMSAERRAWWATQMMWHLDPFDSFSGGRDTCRRVLHPLVSHHPFTGKPCLQLGPSYERSILQGMEAATLEEQEAQWAALVDEAILAGDVYDHVWEDGDLVLWDNSQTLHRSNPYDSSEHVRKALRVGVICGDM